MINNCELSKKISDFAAQRQKFVFAINFDGTDGFALTPDDAAKEGIYFDIEGKTNFEYSNEKIGIKKFESNPVSYIDYKKAFDSVQHYISRGDTFLTNLTFKTELDTDFTLREIFNYSKAKYKILFKEDFVVFSPECFVKTEGNKIKSFPMKGTIDANVPDAENIILTSKKEFCEHTTIVDLIRNDLNIVGKNTQVEKFRYIDKLVTNKGELLQVSSVISSDLPDDYYSSFGDILFKMLPAGSISGAPKEKTIEIINEVESYDRGYYTGIFGYFDGKDFNTAVNIRFVEREGDRLYYKSGGGITGLSDAESEYQELLKKIYVPIS